jgi:hypothetical protein
MLELARTSKISTTLDSGAQLRVSYTAQVRFAEQNCFLVVGFPALGRASLQSFDSFASIPRRRHLEGFLLAPRCTFAVIAATTL